MTNAILAVLKYVRDKTGDEPTQEEIANALESYFIVNEIGNQIKFQRKKNYVLRESPESASSEPFWRLNLMSGPPKNGWIRAGLFYPNIEGAIIKARRFITDSSGKEPSETEIAHSLQSSFILSEIKNQIDWQRNGRKKSKPSRPRTK